MNTIVAIAFGGAFGAVLRYLSGVWAFKVFGDGFPYSTLGVNVVGSFVMGVLVAVFAQYWSPSESVRAFLVPGLLGAFTTFSAFSLDVSALYERGDLMLAGVYISVSVVGAVMALFLGMFLVRSFS